MILDWLHAVAIVSLIPRLIHAVWIALEPDSLAKLASLFDNVWRKLVLEKLVKPGASSRSLLAKRVFHLARSRWSESQIKQLLERSFRNDAARLKRMS
jgi:hypothetical protein